MAPTTRPTVHGTALRIGDHGVLIRGASGAGKSRLALALLEELEAKLIADDRVVLQVEGGNLLASPPQALQGRIEMRGIGILNRPWEGKVRLHLVVDLRPLADLERMPDGPTTMLEGRTLPQLGVPQGDLAHQVLMVKTALHEMLSNQSPNLPHQHDER